MASSLDLSESSMLIRILHFQRRQRISSGISTSAIVLKPAHNVHRVGNPEISDLDNLSQKISKTDLLEPQAGNLLQREAEVLALGGFDGIKRGVSLSMSDLSTFGGNLKAAPLKTLGGFVRDHWSEAAVAGGIAFMAPRKHLNALLLIASGRGVAMSTIDGAIGALDPNQNVGSVRERFANNLAGETRQLVNSLPMTIAGGAAGRSLGNAVFGTGMGALDLAAGRVSMAEVKTNLWKMHDQILPPKAKMAVVDLDGTLVSTSRHLALGIEQGKKQLAANTGLSEEVVSGLMNEQFGKLKSFVNPWTVELALAEKLNVGKPNGMSYEQFRSNVADPYWKIFKDNLAQDLKVFEGVQSTLNGLAKENVSVTILTNSPAIGALPRLKETGLYKQVNNTVMLDNPKPPQGLAAELVKHGQERMAGQMFQDPTFSEIARNLAKPNPDFVLGEMSKRGLRPKEVIVIGDSLESDMMLANKTGARGLWSRWNEVDAPFDAMLNRVTGGAFPPAKTSGVPFETQLQTVPQILENLRPARDITGLIRGNAALPSTFVPFQSYGLSLTPTENSKK